MKTDQNEFWNGEEAVSQYRNLFAVLYLKHVAYKKACVGIALEERDFFCSEFSFGLQIESAFNDRRQFLEGFEDWLRWLMTEAAWVAGLELAPHHDLTELTQLLTQRVERARELALEILQTSRIPKDLLQILGGVPNGDEHRSLHRYEHGCRFIDCYKAWDQVQRVQDELLRFARKRFDVVTRTSSQGRTFLPAHAFPFPALGYVLYEEGGQEHQRMVISYEAPPAPYGVAACVFRSKNLTDDERQWALEILAGWSQAAKAVPYWGEYIQPIEWMIDLSYAFQQTIIPFTASATYRAQDRDRALQIQKVFDLLGIALQQRFRACVNHAAANYKLNIKREGKKQAVDEAVDEVADEDMGEAADIEEWDRRIKSHHLEVQVEASFTMQDLLARLQCALSTEQLEIALLLSEKSEVADRKLDREDVADKMKLPLRRVDTLIRGMRRTAQRVAQDMGLDIDLDLTFLSSKPIRQASQKHRDEQRKKT